VQISSHRLRATCKARKLGKIQAFLVDESTTSYVPELRVQGTVVFRTQELTEVVNMKVHCEVREGAKTREDFAAFDSADVRPCVARF
jgi:hypothetical protein